MGLSKEKTGNSTKFNTVNIPCLCKDCDDNIKENHGCGYEKKYKGKSKFKRSDGDESEEFNTCPQFYANQEFVLSVGMYYEDYKRGALGDIWSLPDCLWLCLRAMECERAVWDKNNMDNM